MADPLSITASIIAVGGAAHVVVKATGILFHIARDADMLAEDVEFFASHISIFGGVISSVGNTIDQHFKAHPTSSILAELHKSKTLPKMEKQVKLLMRRVRHLQPRTSPYTAGLTWKARLVWVWEKPKREELCIWVERMKITFLLIAIQINFETLQEHASSEHISVEEVSRLRRDMADHKRLMTSNMKAMRALQTRLDSFREEKPWHCEDRLEEYDYEGVEVTLLKLVKNTMAREDVFHEPRSSSNVRSVSASGFTTKRDLQDSIETDAQSRDERDGLSDPTPLVMGNDPAPTSLEGENDYMTVQPLNPHQFLDPAFSIEAINGYVGDIHCSAMINDKFSGNIISLAYARKIHASIEDLGVSPSPQQIYFGNGRHELIRGKAMFRWKQSQSFQHLKPLKMTCNVCDHLPYPLIFGQDFLRRRQHYWHR